MQDARLYTTHGVRIIDERDEPGFTMGCYNREVPAESPLLGAFSVVGAVLGLVVICYWLGSLV